MDKIAFENARFLDSKILYYNIILNSNTSHVKLCISCAIKKIPQTLLYRRMYKMIIYGVRTAEGLSISKSVYSFILFFVCGYQLQPRDEKTNLQ
jgi:hypothetical protein